jgi:hypothetical protein
MSKKKKVAVRRTWKINPATRVEKPAKAYDRKKEKARLRSLLKELQ